MGRNPWENLRIDGDNIRMNFMEIWWEVVEWIQLVQDRDKLRDLVNTVMELGVK
jgi:hypothetical protein